MQRQYKKYILLFWGVMDVIAIATYLFYSLGNGRIPFYSDIVHSLSLLKDIGVEGGFYAYAVATVTLQIVLLFSLFFSAGFETANFISTGLFKIVFANCCILAGIVAENMMV